MGSRTESANLESNLPALAVTRFIMETRSSKTIEETSTLLQSGLETFRMDTMLVAYHFMQGGICGGMNVLKDHAKTWSGLLWLMVKRASHLTSLGDAIWLVMKNAFENAWSVSITVLYPSLIVD